MFPNYTPNPWGWNPTLLYNSRVEICPHEIGAEKTSKTYASKSAWNSTLTSEWKFRSYNIHVNHPGRHRRASLPWAAGILGAARRPVAARRPSAGRPGSRTLRARAFNFRRRTAPLTCCFRGGERDGEKGRLELCICTLSLVVPRFCAAARVSQGEILFA